MQKFTIDIINHHWIDNDPNNTSDHCSHGIFILNINDQQILSANDDIEDWTTSTSVLKLLRTIDDDFQSNYEMGIILHCGMIQMISCPISLDWMLKHKDEDIIITDVKKYLTTNDKDVVEYKYLMATIPREMYKLEILKVANQVKDFFGKSKPRTYFDEQEKQTSITFWKEFDYLISKHSSQ